MHADARFAIARAEPGGIQVNRAARIMTAGTHAAFLSANELLGHARQLADETIAKAQAGYEEACERGYRIGLAKAHQQAVDDQVQHGLHRQESLNALQADLNALVLQIVRRLLGEIDCAERVGMLVREGLARVAKLQGEIAIHVNPALREQVAADMAQWQTAYPDISLATLENPEIETDACRIIFPSGRVDGNLRKQLDSLEAALCEACEGSEGGNAAASGDGRAAC